MKFVYVALLLIAVHPEPSVASQNNREEMRRQIMDDIVVDQMLDNLTSVQDFLDTLFPQQNITIDESLLNVTDAENELLGGRGDGVADMASQMNCAPRLTMVPVPRPIDPTERIFPKCVGVKRCTGCCNTATYSCQPTSTSWKVMMFATFTYDGENWQILDYPKMSFEEHDSCACSCELTSADCHPTLHRFDTNTCQCECLRPQRVCSHPQVWDVGTCRCMCPQSSTNCADDEIFNPFTCRCMVPSVSLGGRAGGKRRSRTCSPCKFHYCGAGGTLVYHNNQCMCADQNSWILAAATAEPAAKTKP